MFYWNVNNCLYNSVHELDEMHFVFLFLFASGSVTKLPRNKLRKSNRKYSYRKAMARALTYENYSGFDVARMQVYSCQLNFTNLFGFFPQSLFPSTHFKISCLLRRTCLFLYPRTVLWLGINWVCILAMWSNHRIL